MRFSKLSRKIISDIHIFHSASPPDMLTYEQWLSYHVDNSHGQALQVDTYLTNFCYVSDNSYVTISFGTSMDNYEKFQ